MKSIWKFGPLVADEQEVTMPIGAEILDVQDQGGRLFIWAVVETRAPTGQRRFRIHGTGHPMADDGDLDFIGTVQQAGGALVWHVFEAIAAKGGGS